jgi:hypothetical protein
MALVEAAVADYAEALWAATAPPLLRWVRRMLRELRPSIHLLLQTRAFDEADALANLIRQLAQGQEPPNLGPALDGLASTINLQYGLLPSDPRAAQLEASFRQMLEADTSSYWRTLTDPATLAGHIIEAKNAGLGLDAIAKQVSNIYRANYPASARLVRTLYNAGANRAQLEALRASGYTHKQWLATPGPRTRPAHAQANGQVKPLEQPFVVGGYNLMYPGDRSLGAPAGMTVNCRCTLVGSGNPAGDTVSDVREERIRQGVQYQVGVSQLSARDTQTVLRGFNQAGLVDYLKTRPLQELSFAPLPQPQKGFLAAQYDEIEARLIVHPTRPAQTYKQAFKPQTLETFSQTARNRLEALKFSAIHEIGHHLLADLRNRPGWLARLQQAAKKGLPISRRAAVDWEEYFCECFSAYTFNPRALQAFDPVGYAIIKAAREELKLP